LGFGAEGQGQIEQRPEFVMSGSNGPRIYETHRRAPLRARARVLAGGQGRLLRLRGL
jgi:hypothetical protein